MLAALSRLELRYSDHIIVMIQYILPKFASRNIQPLMFIKTKPKKIQNTYLNIFLTPSASIPTKKAINKNTGISTG